MNSFHNIRLLYNKGIDKETLNNIKNQKYSDSEIKRIYEEVNNSYQTKKKGFKRGAIIFGIIVIIMAVLTYIGTEDLGVGLFTIGFILVAVLLIMVYLNYNLVNKEKRQFLKSVEKGYPNLLASFKFE